MGSAFLSLFDDGVPRGGGRDCGGCGYGYAGGYSDGRGYGHSHGCGNSGIAASNAVSIFAGLSGMFIDPDLSNIHGLNERIRVRSLYDGRDFLFSLVKLYAAQVR